jgi:transcriptional regulator with XRE-family HTH domain
MVSGQRALEARNSLGLSRERVAALCDPPISAKTLERWEKGISPLPRWRAQQLAAIYGIGIRRLESPQEATV